MRSTATGIHHVQLAMPAGGEAAAERFYAELLGMTPLPKPPHLVARGGCWFACGDFQLHVGVEAPFAPARKAHPAVLVSDIASVRASIAARGHEIVEDTQLDGFERFYTSDPFGNRIEIIALRRA
jgi:catechol 2,3-dioxygenase-like lactoylglutathione lyase family enzyme